MTVEGRGSGMRAVARKLVPMTAALLVAAAIAGGAATGALVRSDSASVASRSDAASVAAATGLTVEKSAPATATVGENIVYTIDVANAGTAAATALTLTDPLPAAVEFVSVDDVDRCDQAAGTVTCTFDVAAGGSETFTITTKALESGTVTNTATLDPGGEDPDITASASTDVADAPGLTVDKSAPADALVGGDVVYTIDVANGGAEPATGLTLTDALPAEVEFVSVDDTERCDEAAGTVTCTFTVGAGATETFTITTKAATAGTAANTASVVAGQDPAITDTAATDIREPVTDLTIAKSAPSEVTVGDEFTYTLDVDNVGDVDVTNVVVTDPLPAGVSFVSSTDACAVSAGEVTCDVGDLPAGASATVSFVVSASTTGEKINTATVSSDATEDGEAPNSDSASTTVNAVAAAPGRVISNDTVRLGVVNYGNVNFGGYGVNYVPTGNDGTRAGCSCEGWGAGADAPTRFQGRANNSAGISGVSLVSFDSTATTATSVVDVLRDGGPGLRVTHAFVPSPQTPNLYEISVTLKNMTTDALSDVRYAREMDWDIEPTPFSEYVTINRGASPASLIYSDDNGFADNFPFSSSGPLDPATVNTSYMDKGPADHGARFIFSVGGLDPGEEKTIVLFYGAAGTATDANSAISAAALEVYSLGKPSSEGGLSAGTPNTFIWGFRGVGGTAIIPPTLTLSPATLPTTPGTRTLTATVTDSSGKPVPGAPIVFVVSGANPQPATTVTTGADGVATYTYTATAAGADTVTACIDSDASGSCGTSEVTATSAGGAPPPPPPPAPGNGGGGGGSATTTTTTTTTTAAPPPPLQPPPSNDTFSARVISGVVLVNGQPVTGDTQLKVGDIVDATHGVIEIRSTGGNAQFYDGAFRLGVDGEFTLLELVGGNFGVCSAAARSTAGVTAPNTPVRRLWGKGTGKFKTKARYSSATVRGTIWLTEDQCDFSLTRTEEGTVEVFDFSLRRTAFVGAGREYLAQAPPPPSPGIFVGIPTGTVLINGVLVTQGTQVRSGDRVDVRKGKILLRSTGGQASFYDGIFVVTQGRSRSAVTLLRLVGGNFGICSSRAVAAAGKEKPKKTVRALWGNGKGNFATQSRYSSATVRGTIWLTADRCDGSLTRVVRGVVSVRDFVKRRTVLVRAGSQYLAAAPG